MDIIAKLAAEFHIRTAQVEQTVALIDEGNTIPFIARYRKEVTGGLSDVVLRLSLIHISGAYGNHQPAGAGPDDQQ